MSTATSSSFLNATLRFSRLWREPRWKAILKEFQHGRTAASTTRKLVEDLKEGRRLRSPWTERIEDRRGTDPEKQHHGVDTQSWPL